MKILQLCNKPPYPPTDGGSLAMNSITQGLLAEECEVKVLSVATDKHPVRHQQMDDAYLEATGFESVYVDLTPNVLNAGVAMLCGESYQVQRYISDDFANRLVKILDANQYDIIHIESIFLTPYVPVIRRHSDARIVLRAHNVEHHIWRQIARGTRNPFRAGYIRHLALTLGAYEREHINDYDGIVCITQQDADYFRTNGCKRPIVTIPFAITPEPLDHIDSEPASLFHIGSMDWMPNLEGVEWLLDKVWPVIHRSVPEARLYLAGRKMPQRLLRLQKEGVTILGEVPDAMYFIGSKQINIVPLLSGSGIRVKIIEAMSACKTVISTTRGATGIDCTDGKNILIADTPEQFALHVRRCVQDQEYCQQIGHNAYQLIAERYNSTLLTQQLLAFYNQLIEEANDK